jgi:hypothetical protein
MQLRLHTNAAHETGVRVSNAANPERDGLVDSRKIIVASSQIRKMPAARMNPRR